MNRNLNRMAALVLALAMVLSLACVPASAADNSGDSVYTNGTQTLTIKADGSFVITDGDEVLYSGTGEVVVGQGRGNTYLQPDDETVAALKALGWYYTGTIALESFGGKSSFAFNMDKNAPIVPYQADVKADPDSVTGYTLTLTVEDNGYESVTAFGGWVSYTMDYTLDEDGVRDYKVGAESPYDWKNGMYYLGEEAKSPVDMKLDEASGLWTVSIPLACGTIAVQCYHDVNPSDLNNEWQIMDDYVVEVPYDAVKQSDSPNLTVAFANEDAAGAVDYDQVCTAKDGHEVKMAIYTPYGYDPKDTETKYPVLYLIPGGGTTYKTWFTGGWANNVFDNLIAQGKTAPAILVAIELNDQTYLASDVIGYIESHYNVYTDSAHRALAGTSMGGIATTNLWLNEQTSGLFSTYGVFSGANKAYFENNSAQPSAQELAMLGSPSVLVASGTRDFNAFAGDMNSASMEQVDKWLTARGVEHGYMVNGGGHAWGSWVLALEKLATDYLWAEKAGGLHVERNTLLGTADTEGFSTLKAYTDSELKVAGDKVDYTGSVVLSVGSGADASKLDVSGASVTLGAGDGYYVDDLSFTGGSLSKDGNRVVFTMDEGDLEWNNYGYPVAEGGMEWSCIGGDGAGNYYFNLNLSGVKYDGEELDDVTFRIRVYIWGREFSARTSPSDPGANSSWGAGGYDGLVFPEAEQKELAQEVTVGAEPVWTWVGDPSIDKPILCDQATDDFYISWPSGADASALTDGDVTVTLRSQYGDERVLIPNTGTRTIEQNGKSIPNGEYNVFAGEGVTQVSVNLTVWPMVPVYTTMTIEVDAGKVDGYSGAVSKTYDIASVYTHLVQTGGGLELEGTTVTVMNLFGVKNISGLDISDLFTAPDYYYAIIEGSGPNAKAVAYLIYNEEDGSYSVTENEDEATLFEGSGIMNVQQLGHSVFTTDANNSITLEYNGEEAVFSRTIKSSPSGYMQAPNENYVADDGYILATTSGWDDHQRWGWLYFTEFNGWKESDLAFTDVRGSNWYYDDVMFAYDQKLMNGEGDGLFNPSGTATRAMVWTILARLSGEDTSGGTLWYEAGRDWAVKNSVSDGTEPSSAITREMVATMLYRYLGEPGGSGDLSQFTDGGSVSAWAQDAMSWAVGSGLMVGSNGRLNPKGTATRAELATMLARFVRDIT